MARLTALDYVVAVAFAAAVIMLAVRLFADRPPVEDE